MCLAGKAARGQTKNEKSGTILCPGANRRDHLTFIRALEELHLQGRILGYRDDPRIKTSKLIQWKKFVPSDKFIVELAAAEIVVVPLVDKNLSGGENTLTFAMALGRPVIATGTKSSREIIRNGKTGLLVPPKNAEALKRAIESLRENPELRVSLGRNAREAEKKLSAKTHGALAAAFEIAARL